MVETKVINYLTVRPNNPRVSIFSNFIVGTRVVKNLSKILFYLVILGLSYNLFSNRDSLVYEITRSEIEPLLVEKFSPSCLSSMTSESFDPPFKDNEMQQFLKAEIALRFYCDILPLLIKACKACNRAIFSATQSEEYCNETALSVGPCTMRHNAATILGLRATTMALIHVIVANQDLSDCFYEIEAATKTCDDRTLGTVDAITTFLSHCADTALKKAENNKTRALELAKDVMANPDSYSKAVLSGMEAGIVRIMARRVRLPYRG